MLTELSRIQDSGVFWFVLCFKKVQIPRINETDLWIKVIEPKFKETPPPSKLPHLVLKSSSDLYAAADFKKSVLFFPFLCPVLNAPVFFKAALFISLALNYKIILKQLLGLKFSNHQHSNYLCPQIVIHFCSLPTGYKLLLQLNYFFLFNQCTCLVKSINLIKDNHTCQLLNV